MSITIAPLAEAHAYEVLPIYQAGIDEGNATFKTTAPTRQVFEAGKLPEHRFAAVGEDGKAWAGRRRARSLHAGGALARALPPTRQHGRPLPQPRFGSTFE